VHIKIFINILKYHMHISKTGVSCIIQILALAD